MSSVSIRHQTNPEPDEVASLKPVLRATEPQPPIFQTDAKRVSSLCHTTSVDPSQSPIEVTVIDAREIDQATRIAWTVLRKLNAQLWSPCFDLRLFEVLAKHAPNPKLAIVRQNHTIVGLLPFQGKSGSLARPLGAPLSDQHGLIEARSGSIDIAKVIAAISMSGFVFSGMPSAVDGAINAQKSTCYVADLSAGLVSYQAWRKANWNDQVKKNERRKRQAERQWGPMRLEIADPNTSHHFQTLMAMKQAKYIETNKHNVLAVPWIKKFLLDLYQSKDQDFVGEITLLYFGEHLAALEFGLRAGQAMHSWFPAFDRAYAQVSPGILLMDGMIEACATRGITKVDLGIGHDQYKRHASNAPIEVWSGAFPIYPLRRIAMNALAATDQWMHNHLPEKYASLLGKFERRSEMILASEPTFKGRVLGYLHALKAVG